MRIYERVKNFKSMSKKSLILNNSNQVKGQAIKSVGRMTWHQEPKKDVTNCEKLRGAVNKQRSADIRIGEPLK